MGLIVYYSLFIHKINIFLILILPNKKKVCIQPLIKNSIKQISKIFLDFSFKFPGFFRIGRRRLFANIAEKLSCLSNHIIDQIHMFLLN